MSSKIYKIIVSQRAKLMLGEHIRFLKQINNDAAKKKQQQIVKAINSLAHLPHRFPFFEEAFIPLNKYHKMYIEKWYIVLYQIKDDTVFVDYIIDCRKNYSWLIH